MDSLLLDKDEPVQCRERGERGDGNGGKRDKQALPHLYKI